MGVAGYIAPRHLKAIKDTGNRVLAALDKFDNVGVIDSYFPQADFFTELERFDRYLDKTNRKGEPIDFVSICTPNYLHDAHIRFGLKHGAHVICEKPLVLNPWNINGLKELERETGKKVFAILQLRLHPSIVALKEKIEKSPKGRVHEIELTYITARGNWYYASWKGDITKSGGIATNIGVHFFDMLTWIFGKEITNTVHLSTHDRAAGYLEFENAKVRWFLSISEATLPKEIREAGKSTYRSMNIGGEEINFSEGFGDLHTQSYEAILNGNGFGLEEAKSSIEMVATIRRATPVGLQGKYHPFATLPLSNHPFESGAKS